MPSGLIEDENGVSTGGDCGCDFVEVKLHGLGVAGRQHEGLPVPRSGQTAPNR